jgi:hypothetical protein
VRRRGGEVGGRVGTPPARARREQLPGRVPPARAAVVVLRRRGSPLAAVVPREGSPDAPVRKKTGPALPGALKWGKEDCVRPEVKEEHAAGEESGAGPTARGEDEETEPGKPSSVSRRVGPPLGEKGIGRFGEEVPRAGSPAVYAGGTHQAGRPRPEEMATGVSPLRPAGRRGRGAGQLRDEEQGAASPATLGGAQPGHARGDENMRSRVSCSPTRMSRKSSSAVVSEPRERGLDRTRPTSTPR